MGNNGLNIIVCIKQVPDPDGPTTTFNVDSDNKVVKVSGIPPVLNPYDENALEAALRVKETHGGRITVVSMGKKLTKPVGMKALAVGADEIVLFQDDSFGDLDGFSTAYGLAAAIKKIGIFDLILCGRQAPDSNGGQVGVWIAETLGIPCVSLVHQFDVVDEKVHVERLLSDGYEVLEVEMPTLLSISSEIYELRYTTIAGMMEAKKKPIRRWQAEDVDGNILNMRRMNLVSLSSPISTRTCEMVTGDTPEIAGTKLAKVLIESEII